VVGLRPGRCRRRRPGARHSSWTLEEEVESHTLHLFVSHLRLLLPSGLYPREGRIDAIMRDFPPPTAPREEIERAARALVDELGTLSAPSTRPTSTSA